MSFSKGDVILLPYPFTDLKTTKVRPAVVAASATGHYSDIFVVPLTSRLAVLNSGEFSLTDWSSAGLNVPSALKRGCVLVDTGLVMKKVGSLSDSDKLALDSALRLWLEL
jgi:mRNA interferase MazF